MYHHVKKLMYTVNVGTPDPTFRQHAARTVRRRERRTGGRHAVLGAGHQLRRSGLQRPADGHRHGGIEPSGGHRFAGATASEADEDWRAMRRRPTR